MKDFNDFKAEMGELLSGFGDVSSEVLIKEIEEAYQNDIISGNEYDYLMRYLDDYRY